MATPKSSVLNAAPFGPVRNLPRRHRRIRAFSLVEVVIATAIIAFALLAILGVMAASLSTHANAGNDNVLTLMTESSLQEMRNLGFNSITPGTTYYIYFDALGQVTADGNTNDYEISTATSPTTNSIPASAIPTTFAANTVYQCAITATNDTLPSESSASSSIYQLQLVFTWPVGAPVPKTNVVNATISNPNVY